MIAVGFADRQPTNRGQVPAPQPPAEAQVPSLGGPYAKRATAEVEVADLDPTQFVTTKPELEQGKGQKERILPLRGAVLDALAL